jgi:endonuclease YncB( thermonuclease family)
MRAILLSICIAMSATPALAERHRVTSVHDGDTFSLARRVAPWGLALSVRLNGIDTPEAAPKAQCAAEAEAADAAKWHLRALIAAAGNRVTLTRVKHDKYGGRINASATARIGIHTVNLAAAMIEAGFARAYDGGPRRGWCG